MPLKFIFHISDLHIRTGDKESSRYDEYLNVFNNTIKSITNKQMNFEDCVIIISGDIFHNKNIISNYGLLLYKDFIKSLTKICKVIVFHGNHDKNQNHNNQPSLVFSTSFEIDNLIILNASTTFKIDDIGFSYISIDDTLDNFKKSGISAELPKFKKHNDNNIRYHVALFHGTFTNSKLFNGTELKDHSTYPLEWIKDFDYAILGDIHKRQYNTYKNSLVYGYAGSLIQQNFGEDLIEHGYLIWDLYNKKITEVNVPNSKGMINIKEDDYGILQMRRDGKFNRLEDYDLSLFPKNLEIKLFSKINYNNLSTLLKFHNIIFKVITTNPSNITTNQPERINLTINDNNILDYFNKILKEEDYKLFSSIIQNKEQLLFNVGEFPDELHDECHKKNKDLTSAINDCINSQENKIMKSRFTIKYLEWEGLYCYENKSSINFANLYSKSILIRGMNGTGKSAIYDILTLAIWGSITSSKQNSLSAGIINHNKKTASTIIEIETEGIIYRITRDFSTKEGTNLINNTNYCIYKSNQIHKKNTACKEEIIRLFGTLENFLSSGMITQNIDYDILKLSFKETTDVVDKFCNIEYICKLYNLFKIALLRYKDFKRTIENKKEVYETLLTSDVISDEIINKKKQTLELLKERRRELNSKYDNYNRLNELKIILKDADINHLKSLYHINLNLNVGIEEIHKKPCELSFLIQEEKELKNYSDNDFNEYEDLQLIRIEKPNTTIEEITKKILEIFATTDDMNDYIKTHEKENKTYTFYKILTYEEYQKVLIELDADLKKLEVFNKQVAICDTKINGYAIILSNLNKLNNIKKLDKPVKYRTIEGIAKKIQKYNKQGEQREANDLENQLVPYYAKLTEIKELNDEILIYKKELDNYNNNEEYNYNPGCTICCSRKWVLRMKELNELIKKAEENISAINESITKEGYIKKEWRLNKVKKTLDYIATLESWYYYYVNKILTDSTNEKIQIQHNISLLESIINFHRNNLNYFNIYTYDLYHKQKIIKIHEITNIKQRIDNYKNLKKLYEKWEICQICAAHEYHIIYNEIQPLMKEKLLVDEEIKSLDDFLIKYEAINDYNKKNKDRKTKLNDILIATNKIIGILDVIINNFQAFRIETYDKYVLNNLCIKVNTIIKSLCHTNTKPFQLDYLINVVKDVVHINWLISNDSNSTNKIISIHQASGFQRFVISFALRMSLFVNQNEPLSNILFIDEGFNMFDYQNISIVPSFLKNLLSYFNTIVLVSHIDLIQETTDEVAEIIYDKQANKSWIIYI